MNGILIGLASIEGVILILEVNKNSRTDLIFYLVITFRREMIFTCRSVPLWYRKSIAIKVLDITFRSQESCFRRYDASKNSAVIKYITMRVKLKKAGKKNRFLL